MASPRESRRSTSRAHPQGDGRFAYAGLERAIHEKARLGLLTSLVAHRHGLSFNDLKELCSLTDGNLNRHLAVLENSGLIRIKKSHHRRRPQTRVCMTSAGRRRFQDYVDLLARIVADAAAGRELAGAVGGSLPLPSPA